MPSLATDAPAPFNPDAPHHQKPKLRPVRGFPLQAKGPDGKEVALLGLADARQVSDKMVATAPGAQLILPLLDGTKSIDDIIRQVGRGLQRPFVEHLVAQLDDAGLLYGPTFDALVAKMRTQFDSQPNLPPGSTAAFAEMLAIKPGEDVPEDQRLAVGTPRIPEVLGKWIEEAQKRPDAKKLDALPKVLVAPHLDYARGWINYGAAWGSLPTSDRPDRVIILGTNHFGESTGICACDKGYETPLGVCAVDQELLEGLKRRLGSENAEKAFRHRYDHEREHSIELQIPWIQHTFGKNADGDFVKVFGVLIHDPSVNNGESYDGKGLAFEPFIEALRDTIASLPGRTLIISSADLSHVGPAFGDKQALAGDAEEAKAFRDRIIGHDREMLALLCSNRADDIVASMAWQQNPTRWCSLGNLVAAMKLTKPEKVELLSYAGAMDQQGVSLVTSCAMAMS